MNYNTIEKLCDLHARIGWQGLTKAEYLDNGDYYLVTGVDFSEGLIDFQNCHFVAKDRYEQDEHIQLSEDDVLVTKDGTIGKVAIVKGMNKPATLNSGVFVVRPFDKTVLSPQYLMLALRSANFKRFIDDIKVGCTIAHLNQAKFLKYKIPVPTLSEQKEITDIILIIENIITVRKMQLAKLDELVKARFVEMFIEKGYPVLMWNDVFNTKTGKLDSNAMVEDGEYPFFTCSKEVLRINQYAFDQEALLLAGNNAAGKYDVKYYKGKFNAYQRTYVLGLKQAWSYRLFQYQLEDKLVYLQQQSLGGLTKYLTMKILGELSFIIPPMDKQGEFERFVSQTDKSKVAVQKALNEAQLLFDSLMQEYFG